MANQKIFAVSLTILQTMMKIFPKDHLDFMFAGLLDPGDIVEMVMLDLIKRSYDKKDIMLKNYFLMTRCGLLFHTFLSCM